MSRERIRRAGWRGVCLVAGMLLLGATARAVGAAADAGFLRQLAGPAGCWVFAPADGCAVYRTPPSVSGAPTIASAALSSDGRNLYVAANANTNLIVAFGRAADGSLVPVTGRSGCILPLSSACERPVYRQRKLSGLALSPDGRNLYSIADYRPVQAVQALRRLAGGGLHNAEPSVSCAGARGVQAADRRHKCRFSVGLGVGPRALAVSTDGHQIYVAAGDRLVTLGRTATGGVFLAGCVGPTAAPLLGVGCAAARATTHASGIAVSPSGRSVYVASADGLAVFDRDQATGRLTQPAGRRGCFDSTGAQGCAVGRAVARPRDPTRSGGSRVAISRDGRNVYLAGADGIATFERDPRTGELVQPPGPEGCITRTGSDGCTVGRSLAGIEGLKVSPDGTTVYAAASTSRGVAVLTRAGTDAAGSLTQASGPGGCVNGDGSDGCARARAVGAADTVSVSTDSRTVYVGSLDAGLAVFHHG